MLTTVLFLALAQNAGPYFEAPAGQQYARVSPGGLTILPNGRFLTPKGERLYGGENVWQVAVRPDGDAAVACHDGGMMLYSGLLSGTPTRKFLPRKQIAPAALFTRDGSKLVVSLGDDGKMEVLNGKTFETVSTIDAGKEDSYINDFVFSEDEKRAYGLDVANQEVVTFDLVAGKVLSRVPAGREPYAVVRSGDSLYVANIGIFDYSVVPKGLEGKYDPRGLSVPPFAFPSRDAENGRDFEGRRINGLGKALVPDAQSVWKYSLANPAKPVVQQKAKCGLLIHGLSGGGEDKSVGGSAPNAVLIQGSSLWVSNANNDTLQEFDAASLRLRRTVRLAPTDAMKRYRGVIPSGMALSKDGKRLYLCESGLNSVAVIDIASGSVVGRIPSGWFPMQVKLSPDGRELYVACQKGIGRGPRGPKGARKQDDERFGLPDMPGMIQRVGIPDDATLATWNREVLRNNGLLAGPEPVAPKVFPVHPGQPSANIKYVVFITKENHTFDGIFGGLKGAKGDPDYAEFGMQGWIREKGKTDHVSVMPNHIRLAEQFAISDNFYMEPDASGDGHRWLVGVYPSLWTTRVFYAGWDFRLNDKAKGRLVSFGSNGSQIPEDYLENGSIWEHLERNGVSFRNYGEGFEFPGVGEDEPEARSGAEERVNFPMPLALYKNTCFEFPIFNTNIPDIARADWFFQDLEKYRKGHGGAIPRFLNIALCNDHGTRPRPEFGYPYVCSYMADNDLALGKVVEYLSHTPEWKNMAIFVTQDDSGADNDHIDRHRSYVLAISPWAKHSYVSSHHTSIMSIIRSIYLIFGLGPNNMFDALATPLYDMFTDTPDFTPYKAVGSDPRVFKPEDTLDPNDPQFKKRRQMPSVKMDDPKFMEWLRNRGKQ